MSAPDMWQKPVPDGLEDDAPITVAWWDGRAADRLTLSRATVRRNAAPNYAAGYASGYQVITESGLQLVVDLRQEGITWIRGHYPDDAEDVRVLAVAAMLSR